MENIQHNYEDILEGKAIMDVNEHARIEGGQRDAYITRSMMARDM